MEEVRRATFEQVYNAQNELIFGETGLDVLAEKNETIHPNSRRVFFENLALSLIGMGLKYHVKLKFNGNSYNLGSVSVFARKMAYMTDTDDKKQPLVLKGTKIRIPIKNLWIALREALYEPMDEALTLGLKTSAEIPVKRGGAYSVGTDGKGKKTT